MSISKNSLNNFSTLNIQDLVDTFGLKKQDLSEISTIEATDSQKQELTGIINYAKDNIEYWNEQELIINHLAFILKIASLYGKNYSIFAERNISAVIDDYQLGGIVDLLVAKGKYEPRQPYFFIQEFKKAKNPNGDPLSQLLGEMLVAQKLNSEDTLYGAYIVGRFWYFVTMEDRIYSEELPLDSINMEDLVVIIAKLNWIKKYIEEKLKSNN